jgi:[glutamine synthetase] adenylyltransferase / [glutamine synthetase]-adenylyl-L-tyrosine phosphorylase
LHVATLDSTPQLEQLRLFLESPASARQLLHAWHLRDLDRGYRNLEHLGRSLTLESLRDLCVSLQRLLPRCPDPDMALNNLERFLANPLGALKLPTLLEYRARTLEILLQLFSVSHFFSDLLSLNPDFLDMLKIPLRRSPSPAELRALLQADVDAAGDDEALLRAFRRFRQRQNLRIGTNDIIRDRPLEEITRDLSRVADASVEVALATALQHVSKRFGQPTAPGGEPARCVVLAFGKHGGEELNYSSDIDLMFLYDEEGSTQRPAIQGAGMGNDEFYARVASEVIRLLSAHTDRGQAYRVDLQLRPEGQRGPLATSLASTLSYYDTLGRTWERQALIKVRPVAGDLELGERFLQAIESFVYRKYLTFAEINEIKSMKRRIEQKASRAGLSLTEVKTGRGGIRDIEFTIQFLQLLNGGDLLALRQRTTLLAMEALERVGCLTDQEYRVLDDAYRFLRKTEHRLQLLFDLQTHQLPEREEELTKLALRMGYPSGGGWLAAGGGRRKPSTPHPSPSTLHPPPSKAFLADYREKTEPTHRILEHLLHQTFAGEGGQAEPESDLILDPNPDPETIRGVLGRYPFRDVQAAYQNLTQLAQEEVPFLSTRRCRHFLASIAPSLLRTLAETPNPDMALVNLEKVTHSLGAKTILWELFSFNAPSLKLYVDLCAWSQFLSEILINNPGMIDELLDSLVLNQPRSAAELRAELIDLCRGADDLEPILHSFQDKELLRIGVRGILGKDTIQETTAALSDLAETILCQLAGPQYTLLEKRHGVPTLTEGPRAGQRCRYVLLALGKLGGREMTYHSDLDLIFLYEGDGRTVHPAGLEPGQQEEATDHFSFFSELARRIIREASFQGPMGRLYQVDMRLRPTGKAGGLVITLEGFRNYFHPSAGGAQALCGAQLWERQILTRGRVVHGDRDFGAEVMAAVAEAMDPPEWGSATVDEILSMRQRLEASRGKRDLKRGVGGMMDVEFLVETFQLKYGRQTPALRQPNIWQGLAALETAGLLSCEEKATLEAGYDFLLRVQSRLRLVHNRTLDELPESPGEIDKLARRLGFESGPRFLAMLDGHTTRIREVFGRLLNRER